MWIAIQKVGGSIRSKSGARNFPKSGVSIWTKKWGIDLDEKVGYQFGAKSGVGIWTEAWGSHGRPQVPKF